MNSIWRSFSWCIKITGICLVAAITPAHASLLSETIVAAALEAKENETISAVFAINMGFRNDNPELAARACNTVVNSLTEKGIPAICDPNPALCSSSAQADANLQQCWDLSFVVPPFSTWMEDDFNRLVEGGEVIEKLKAQFPETITIQSDIVDTSWETSILAYARMRGIERNTDNSGLFLAMRKLITAPEQVNEAKLLEDSQTEDSQVAVNPPLKAAVSKTSKDTFGIASDQLVENSYPMYWDYSVNTQSSRSTTDYDLEILAPGFNGEENSSGHWVLIDMGAGISQGTFDCLYGKFRHIQTNEEEIVYAGNCPREEDTEKLAPFALPEQFVMTGVGFSVSNDNVSGISFAKAKIRDRINLSRIDFLEGENSFVISGEAPAEILPPTSYLYKPEYPYAIVGIAVAVDGEAVSFRLNLGLILPEKDSDYYGQYAEYYILKEVEAYIPQFLQSVYSGILVDNIEFSVFDDCVSTIPSIEFCDYLKVDDAYSVQGVVLDQACNVACNTAYGVCYPAEQACRVVPRVCVPFVGCSGGGCPNCSKARSSCYGGCNKLLSGSVDIQAKKIHGLEKLEFKQASITHPVGNDRLAVDVEIEIPSGQLATVLEWELCQSGICFGDVNDITANTIKATATGSLYASKCPLSDADGVFFEVSNVQILALDVWNIAGFVDDVTATIDSTLSWLGDHIHEALNTSVADKWGAEYDKLLETIEGILNDSLQEVPIYGCNE